MSTIISSLEKGLMGHWRMNNVDTSSGTLYDRSGFDRHGVLSGSEQIGQSGRVSESFRYPGVSTQQTAIDLSGINWTGSHTLSVWVYYDPNSSGASSNLGNAVFGDPTFNGPCLFADLDNNRQRFWDENADGNVNLAISNINKGEWNHVVGIKDGANVDLIFNANRVNSGTLSTNNPSQSTQFIIGGTDSQSSMEGRVDDARLYNRALSDSEIEALYNMRSGRYANV